MCIPDSRYGLSLAWVTSENSTGIRHLETLLHWTLSCLLASLLGVWCWLPLRGSTPTASAPVQLPTPSAGSRRQLSFASPYHFRVRRDFMSKNPLSGFAPKQTIESSALAAYPHSATASQPSSKPASTHPTSRGITMGHKFRSEPSGPASAKSSETCQYFLVWNFRRRSINPTLIIFINSGQLLPGGCLSEAGEFLFLDFRYIPKYIYINLHKSNSGSLSFCGTVKWTTNSKTIVDDKLMNMHDEFLCQVVFFVIFRHV